MTSHTFTATGPLVRHQIRQYLTRAGVPYREAQHPTLWKQGEFTVECDDATWLEVQAWAAKCDVDWKRSVGL